MKTTGTLATMLLMLAFVLLGANVSFGVEYRTTKLTFSQGSQPSKGGNFCVTDDGLFIIPDATAGNVKIYEHNGKKERQKQEIQLKLSKIIGSQSQGSDELAEPTTCFYDNQKNRLGIYDDGARTIFIFDRIHRLEFKLIQKIYCLRGGYDFNLIGDNVLVSGKKFDDNKKPFDLYSHSFSNNQTTFLLPSYRKYGLKSRNEYETEFHGSSNIRALGLEGWFDVHESIIYFVWKGSLRINKLDLNYRDEELIMLKAGNTRNYKSPRATKKLLEGRYKNNGSLIKREYDKMSFAKDIFVGPSYILTIYEGPIIDKKLSHYGALLYTHDGDYIDEKSFSLPAGSKFWFDKKKNILYILSN